MKRATFQIPQKGNDGKRFPTKAMAEVQREVLEMFGGCTVRKTQGAWLGDDGKTYIDENLEYTVVMEEGALEKLVGWLARKRDQLEQEAMFLEVSEVETKLI